MYCRFPRLPFLPACPHLRRRRLACSPQERGHRKVISQSDGHSIFKGHERKKVPSLICTRGTRLHTRFCGCEKNSFHLFGQGVSKWTPEFAVVRKNPLTCSHMEMPNGHPVSENSSHLFGQKVPICTPCFLILFQRKTKKAPDVTRTLQKIHIVRAIFAGFSRCKPLPKGGCKGRIHFHRFYKKGRFRAQKSVQVFTWTPSRLYMTIMICTYRKGL